MHMTFIQRINDSQPPQHLRPWRLDKADPTTTSVIDGDKDLPSSLPQRKGYYCTPATVTLLNTQQQQQQQVQQQYSTRGTSLLIHATNTLDIDKRNVQALHKQPNKSAALCASLLVQASIVGGTCPAQRNAITGIAQTTRLK